MRGLIHGLKSLARRPAKTAMLFIILFIVFSLVFTGFIIQNSITRSKEYIRNQIGSAVEYRVDYSAFTQERSGEGGRPTQMLEVPALSLAVAERISLNQYVERFFITKSANASSSSADPAQTQGSTDVFQRNFSDFTLTGTNQTDHLDFLLGNVQLVSGRTLNDDDLGGGHEVVLISQDVATENSLRVGDTISLAQVTLTRPDIGGNPGSNQDGPSSGNANDAANTDTSTEKDYEIIGIYTAVGEDFNVNTIFTSNTIIDEMNATVESDEIDGSIVFLLDNPDHVTAFKAEASPLLTSKYHILYSDDTEYEQLTKPLNLISFITSILIWVVFFAGAAIIMALVTIFVRDRKFEIGLLLSSGEGRVKIIGQFVFEILVISIGAFLASMLFSNIASRGVSSWIVDNELLSSSSLISTTTAAAVPGMGNMGGMFRNFQQSSTSLYGAVDMQNVADHFNIAVTGMVIWQLMMASIALILFGSSIPLIVIMGYKPRRIMQDDT